MVQCLKYITPNVTILLFNYFLLINLFNQLTGMILRLDSLNSLTTDELYEDEKYWLIEEGEEDEAKPLSRQNSMRKEYFGTEMNRV